MAEQSVGEARYVYDALGRRIAKEVNGERTVFGWDGDTLAYESDEHGSTHYVYEPGSFVPLAQYVTAPVAGMATPVRKENDRYTPEDDPLQRWPERVGDAHVFYYHCDQIGTPLLMTDDASEVVWEASYKAWGETQKVIERVSQAAGVTARNRIRFQGQQEDAESGLHYNRHRYYDPAMGRFVSPDPVKFIGGTNFYQYADDPLMWADPLGLAVRPGGACKHDTGLHGELSPNANRAPGNRNVRDDGFIQSHHPVQNEWAENNVAGYDRNAAPAVLLPSASGDSHAQISAAQRALRRNLATQPGGKWGSTSITDEFNIGYRQMINAGVPQDVARRAMRKSYKYFDCIGAFKK